MFSKPFSLWVPVWAITLSFTLPCQLHAQGTKADYERADRVRSAWQGKVFHDRVEPQWLPDSRFWYRVDTGRGTHQYMLVDPATGEKRDAFDHGQLAAALSKAGVGKPTAESLPLRALEFHQDGGVSFVANGTRWTFDPKSGSLQKAGPAGSGNETTVPVLPGLRSERRSGDNTSVLFVNHTSEPVKLYWVGNVANPVEYAEISPGERHEQNTYAGHVWLARDPKGRTLGIYEAADTPGVAVIDGSWKPGRERGETRGGRDSNRGDRSPDRRWRARIEAFNLVVTDTTTGDEVRLTTDGTEDALYLPRYYWAPNSRYLSVIQERQGEHRQVTLVESSPRDQLQPKVHTFDYAKPGDRIDQERARMFDLEKREPIPFSEDLFPNPYDLGEFRWAPDSSEFTFLYNQRGHQVLRLVGLNPTTGQARAIIDERSETFICYSSKSYLRQLPETHEAIWMSERDGWNHLYLYDTAKGTVKNQITKGEWVVRSVDRVDREKRQIWFQAGGIRPGQDPYHVHFCRVDFDGSHLVILTEGDGTHSVSYSPDGTCLVDTWSRVDLAPVTELRSTKDGSLICPLEVGDSSALSDAGWQTPERFVAKGRDGTTDIYGVIFRPSTFDPARKYPVIEQIYAGPHSAHVPKRFAPFQGAQSMAELGFILVQIDAMGTSLRSKKFHDVCWKNLGDAGFPDRVLWIQAAAKTRPWLDLSRVGIYGGSAGGQNAMRALIDHGDFYRVAVADCGCHDNRMDKIWWNEQWMGWPVGPEYAAASNVEQAFKLQGKLLLIVGEMDHNVDPASTMQVVNALIKADKDFDLLVVPGADHGAAGTKYGTRRQRDYFVRNLLGVEPRWAP